MKRADLNGYAQVVKRRTNHQKYVRIVRQADIWMKRAPVTGGVVNSARLVTLVSNLTMAFWIIATNACRDNSAKQDQLLLNARIVLQGSGPTTGKIATIAHRVNITMKNGPQVKVAAKTAQPASGLGKKKRNVTIVA